MIDLRPDQLAIVQNILRAELPEAKIWAFGSRARWTSSDDSDLDLAICAEAALPGTRLRQLHHLFEESALPFSVDVVDWRRIDEDFRSAIREECVPFAMPKSGHARSEPWHAVPLGECAAFLSGGTPSKRRDELWQGPIPWVRAKDMKQLRLRDTQNHVSPAAIDNGTRLAPVGSTLMLVHGMTLHNDLNLGVAQREMAFNQDVKALVPKPIVDPYFLAYSLLGNKIAIRSLVDPAFHGWSRINIAALKSFPIAVPPLDEQRRIAAVLSVLDDKIELNRKMSRTLEAVAEAIFESWFVDFDGHDDLVESEVGPIPRGWRIGALGELFVLQRGFDLPKKARAPGPYTVVSASGNHGSHSSFKVQGPGVVTGRSGKLGEVFLMQEAFWPLNTTLWIERYINSSPHHAYFLLKSLRLDRFNAGLAVPTLNRNHIESLRVLVPPHSLVRKYEELVGKLFERGFKAGGENQSLAQIRDTILPKLISGELRVQKAKILTDREGLGEQITKTFVDCGTGKP